MQPPTTDFSKWSSFYDNLKDPANYQPSLKVDSIDMSFQRKYEETIKKLDDQKIKCDEERLAYKSEKKKLEKEIKELFSKVKQLEKQIIVNKEKCQDHLAALKEKYDDAKQDLCEA
jgi:hypothetical protein